MIKKTAIAIILVLLIGVVILYGCTSTKQTDNEISSKQDSEWQKYSNREYGFEFEYKKEWNYQEDFASEYDVEKKEMIKTNERVITFYIPGEGINDDKVLFSVYVNEKGDNGVEQHLEYVSGWNKDVEFIELNVGENNMGYIEKDAIDGIHGAQFSNKVHYISFFKFLNDYLSLGDFETVVRSLKFN